MRKKMNLVSVSLTLASQ